MTQDAALRIALVSATGDPRGPEGGDLTGEIAAAAEAGADVILLPQLSFYPYFPARRDRAGLELGERLPSDAMTAATEAAGGCLVAAGVYECVGEGVFYSCGLLARHGEEPQLKERQRAIEASRGRYEKMFFSPGFGRRSAARLPWGRTAMLVGADVRDASAWAEVADLGSDLVLAGVSEPAERWEQTRTIAGGLSAAHGIPLAVVNRGGSDGEPEFSGGGLVTDGSGVEIEAAAGGIHELATTPKGANDD